MKKIISKNLIKRFSVLLALIFFLHPELLGAQSFSGVYGNLTSPRFVNVHQKMQQGRFLENIAGRLSSFIALPEQVLIVLTECGVENAFYHPQQRGIVLCHEQINAIAIGIRRDFSGKVSPDEINRLIHGAVIFILMHEVGHALIHLLRVPILGREEDAADQVGAFFTLNSLSAEYNLIGSLWTFRAENLRYTRQHFSAAHSLPPQRQSNLACLAVGKDPGRFSYLISDGYLSRDRLGRCNYEYAQLDYSVRKLLGHSVRMPPLRR